ncbi:MAG: hypothetical protein DPW09_01650 [Anaerolineae bacterium]|nr:hypothetical protein [Anaerolineales bacterium]MCQ3972131.1 hypothetical protein [Anaerolineae bacterium]
MEKTLVDLSTEEFEEIVERTIDKRLQVWLTQLMDALLNLPEEDEAKLQPDFAASLQRSIEQARSGEGADLRTFREQLGR